MGRYERWDPARHGPAFADLSADREVMRFLGGRMHRHAALEISERIADHWETYGFGLWAAIDPADGRVAGFTGACLTAWHPSYAQDVEVGWRLARTAWGRGYATEAASAALRHGFDELGLNEVVSLTATTNTRSERVMQRIGMQKAGEFDHPVLPEGHRLRRHVLYRVTAPAGR